MSDLITRITAAHQMAIGQMENAARQDEHVRWKGIVRLLEDARDELNRPKPQTLTLGSIKGKVA